MSSVYEVVQPSCNEWPTGGGERMYYGQLLAPNLLRAGQLTEFDDLESQMARFEVDHDALIDEVRRLYVLQEDQSVANYLRKHRKIPQLLIDAVPHLSRSFGDAVFALRAAADEHDWEMLYAIVQWPRDPQDALAALDAFDEEWWLANSYPAGADLTFTYKLV